jgi:RNA polymerase sigma factor for flagellar operon FliA
MSACSVELEGTRPSNESIVNAYGALVRRVCRRVSRRLSPQAGICAEDLESAGYVGLLEAADRFNWCRPEEFVRFAEFRVKGAMVDELRRWDPMSREDRRRSREIESARVELRHRLSREGSRSEVARAARMNTNNVHVVELRTAAAECCDLPETASSQGPDALSLAINRDHANRMNGGMNKLSPRHRSVLQWYFIEGVSLTAAAGRLGVSVGRASQLKSAALTELRGSALSGAQQCVAI